MQNVVFVGRLSADPQVTDDFGKAVFRLLENRGRDAATAFGRSPPLREALRSGDCPGPDVARRKVVARGAHRRFPSRTESLR